MTPAPAQSAAVRRLVAEAVGQIGIALAFTFVVVAMIYATGHLSGAHINPAVTIAFWSVRRFPPAEVVLYILAQSAGVVAASLALRSSIGPVGNMGRHSPAFLARPLSA